VAHFPGAGAAGGLGAGLNAFLNAELRSGVELVLQTVRFDELLCGANLVITGEGKLDKQTAHGKTPWGVAAAAKRARIPVIVFGGSVPSQPSRKLRAQFDAIVPITRKPMALEESMRCAAELLEKSVADSRMLLKTKAGMFKGGK
jgi:glycerate kinase